MIKRIFDIIFSVILLLIFALPMLFIALIIGFSSKDSIIYWADRVGKNGIIFKMPKFRSMSNSAPIMPIIENPKYYYNFSGKFIRHSSLDELPQLYSIIKGDMSLVGPRPSSSQEELLLGLRREKKIDTILPGLTGLAQINGRDKITITEKVQLDLQYMQQQSLWLDVKILFITMIKVMKLIDISH